MNNNQLITLAEKNIKKYDCDHLKEIGILPLNDIHHIPTITYPPWPNQAPVAQEKIFQGITENDILPFTLYFHIPFCEKLCSFCQFDTSFFTSAEECDKYIQYMEKEILLWKKIFPSITFSPSACFIGGGTPSVFNERQWKTFLTMIHSHFNFKNCKQISVDVEPRTMCGKDGIEKLKTMKKLGISRICLGAQSFDDSILKQMNRPHNVKDIFEAAKNIKRENFKSFLLDLIYGFPEHDLDMWINNLQQASKLNVDGYQLYQLRLITFRPKVFKSIKIKNDLKNAPSKFLNLHDVYLMKMLNNIISEQNGYRQFGRGVYLKSANHNSKYLKLIYKKRLTNIGIGKGAVSHIKKRGLMHIGKGLDEYYQLIDRGLIPANTCVFLSDKQDMKAYLILSLKNNGFVNKNYFKKKTGKTIDTVFGKKILQFKKLGLLKENANVVSFTKKGGFFDDDLLFHFYDPEEIPLPKSAYSNGKLSPFYGVANA